MNVKVNGAHIKNSPFIVTVHMPPNHLSQPVATIPGLKRPCSLVYLQDEDKVLTTLVNDGRLMKIDMMQPGFRPRLTNFVLLPFVSEITQDKDRLCYH